jgi:hypothetical protein
MKTLKKSPRGVVYRRPIALRLMPEELAQVQRVARKQESALSATARGLLLRGLDEWQRENPSGDR